MPLEKNANWVTNCISCYQHWKQQKRESATNSSHSLTQFTWGLCNKLLTHILKISVAPHCWRALLLLLDQGWNLLDSILVLGDRGSRQWKRGVHCFGRRSANPISRNNLLLEHLGLLLLRRNRSWGVQNVHASAWWCQLRLLAWTWHHVFSFCTT